MFSIVMPMDLDRLEQFTVTKQLYDRMPQEKEFLIPTRHRYELHKYLVKHKLMDNVRLLPYVVEKGFNPSEAFNVAVRASKYNYIIITSPEVKPTTDVLEQLEKLIGQNVICQVWDEDISHGINGLLVSSEYRNRTPAFYFLAMFNKIDIEKINGWDEDFMQGYAYEDDDFGERWIRAGLPFIFRDDVQGVHQYHPRSETIPGGTNTNYNLLQTNNSNGVIRCANGLIKLGIQ